MAKWVTVQNNGDVVRKLEQVTMEILAITEEQLGEDSHLIVCTKRRGRIERERGGSARNDSI